MKKNFISTILGSMALMLGFTSCEEGLGVKSCYNCTLGGYSDQVCRADFTSSTAFDNQIAYYRSLGYTCN